jgi:two-component system phosphate regulon response regulator PhoB
VATILVVDDERDVLSVLDFNLRAAGFDVRLAASGAEAVQQLEAALPDLVLLDVMLPDTTGTELCRWLRSEPRTRGVPVVILTARRAEVDRVVAFELGADDYVTKPFSVRELILRIRAILRRSGPSRPAAPTGTASVGAIRVDADAHRAYVDGREIELTAIEFKLLALLAARADRVQARDLLLWEVWGLSGAQATRTVDTHVKRLREKLGTARNLLQTVRGVGYRLVARPDPP